MGFAVNKLSIAGGASILAASALSLVASAVALLTFSLF
jgi:hypothetical protein